MSKKVSFDTDEHAAYPGAVGYWLPETDEAVGTSEDTFPEHHDPQYGDATDEVQKAGSLSATLCDLLKTHADS